MMVKLFRLTSLLNVQFDISNSKVNNQGNKEWVRGTSFDL